MMDSKKMLIISLSMVAVAVLIAVMVTQPLVSATTLSINGGQKNFPAFGNGKPNIMPNGWPHRMMCFGPIEVSEGFKEKVINIIKSDKDVQNLLNDGYSIINVRPVVKTIVGDDGSVTMKATGAIVTLSKESTRVIVKVDVENAKVTEIVTFTETTITKP